MSHSTTSTTAHVLAKYSRSHPATGASQIGASSDSWEHFTNPIIRLELHKTTSSKNELESVRLRIVWVLDGAARKQQEMIFEDIDLLSFSKISGERPATQNAQGLPLKAVYRGVSVGIRYLHIHQSEAAPIYNRFQVLFTSSVAANEFIDSIRYVCPCKAHAPPTPAARNPTILQTVATQNAQRFSSLHFSSPVPPVPKQSDLWAVSTPPRTTMAPPSSSPLARRIIQPPSSSPPRPVTSSPNPFVPQYSPSLPALQSSRPGAVPPAGQTQQYLQTMPSRPLPEDSLPPSSLPNPSPPPPSLGSANSVSQPGPPPPPNSREDGGPSRAQLLESLQENPELHKLGRTELERLVAQVVREDGFKELLETLDTMWAVRGFLKC